MNFDEQDEKSFFQKHRVAVIVGVLLFAGAVFFAFKMVSGKGGSSRSHAPVMVSLSLPPPPPPPTPVPTPPPPQPEDQVQEEQPDEKMIEAPMDEPDVKPEPDQPKPADEPPDEPLGTGVKGDGPDDGFGLGSSGNGGGRGRGGQGGTVQGWYNGLIKKAVIEALQNNPKTRTASMDVKIRIWANASGRITRAELAGSSGDRSLDESTSRAILGKQLPEGPPKEIKMPISIRITAKRPDKI